MNASEFAKMWRQHAEDMYASYTSNEKETSVSHLLHQLELSEEKFKIAEKMIETIVVDTHYAFLLGLDGCANIGGIQQDYRIYDENGNLIFEPGDLEGEAYEEMQENFLKTKTG